VVCDIFFTLIEGTGPLPTAGIFEIPLYRILPEVRLIVHEWTQTLFQDEYVNAGVAKITRELQEEYCFAASAKHRSPSEIQKRGEMLANEHPGTDEEIINDYLEGTFMYDLMHLPVAIPVPERLRPEHAVIVAGSGGGKTQLLESFILADLDDEACPGVIVIDSKGELIDRISRLAMFEPMTGGLRDRLIIIDHKDRPALNMFDVDPEVVDTKINEVASLMRYFFGGLFGSQLSDQMDVLFLPLLHMILRMPGATLHTFAALVDDPTAFPDIIAKVPPGPRDFILNHYNDRGYAQTKTGIVTRLHRIINEVTLDDMFSASHNAVDIGKALNEGKIILVSTDADGLQDLSPIFGKYFIAQVMNAGLSRGSRQRDDRRPIHFYIDECAPYVDDKLAQMLTTIRSYGIGLMMAFQGVWQMKSHTAVITGNTGIKIMGSVEDDSDAKAFASSMRTDPKFIMSQRKVQGTGRFAVYTRDLSHAIPVTLPFGMLDKRPQMDDAAYEKLRQVNQAIVTGKAVSLGGILIPQTKPRPVAPVAPAPKRPAKSPPQKIDPDSGERTKPTGNWEP